MAKRRTKKRRTPPRGPGGQFRKRATARRKGRRAITIRKKRRAIVARKRSRGRRAGTRRRRRRGTGGAIRFKPVRGRIYRRNPGGFNLRGMGRQVIEGAQRAAFVVVGKAAGRFVNNLIPIPKTTMIGNVGGQVLSALLLGMVGKRFLPGRAADDIFVGALVGPIETFAKGLPVVGPLLGEDPFLPVGEDPFLPVGNYPELTPGMESYPEQMGEEVADEFYY